MDRTKLASWKLLCVFPVILARPRGDRTRSEPARLFRVLVPVAAVGLGRLRGCWRFAGGKGGEAMVRFPLPARFG